MSMKTVWERAKVEGKVHEFVENRLKISLDAVAQSPPPVGAVAPCAHERDRLWVIE